MIEVKAKIYQRSVFITGECIECQLSVTNNGTSENNSHDQNSRRTPNIEREPSDARVLSKECDENDNVVIAWASALVYCHCNVNERLIKLPKSMRNPRNFQVDVSQITSFSPVIGEKGYCLSSTDASVLFCDLKLKKGESKTFVYSQHLPHDFPPSYKGQHIKLSYKVCIGIGRIGKPLSMLRLPFRLYEVQGILRSLKERPNPPEVAAPQPDHSPSKSKNPFLKEDSVEQCSILDAAMENLTVLSVKRNMNTYNIQSVKGAVGKFALSKHYYRLGEDVLGTFDFSAGSISCIKYTVHLQVEERISKNFLHRPTSTDHIHYLTLSSYEECCQFASKTNFSLPVPVTATADFSHKIVSVHWRLYFEFIIDSSSKEDEAGNGEMEVPVKLQCETMLWDLPLHVLATNPIQASLMMQAESADTLILNQS